jgi:hypothetical protein
MWAIATTIRRVSMPTMTMIVTMIRTAAIGMTMAGTIAATDGDGKAARCLFAP